MSDAMRWAVVGVGTAGLARARAIVGHPRCRLTAVWRGKNAERFPGARMARSLDEAIELADAVAICSPDRHHAQQVQRALEAGRHVVVEYPLASHWRSAAALLDLARNRDRVLHVEHIELLHAPQLALKAHVRRDPVKDLVQTFDRPGPEDVAADELIARNLARLHRAVDLCGEVQSIDELDAGPGRVHGHLTHVTGATTTFTWQQSPYLSRATKQIAHTFGGDEWTMTRDVLRRGRMPQTLMEVDPLFDQDHAFAMRRIETGRDPYLSEARLLHVLEVRDRLAAGRTGPIGTL